MVIAYPVAVDEVKRWTVYSSAGCAALVVHGVFTGACSWALMNLKRQAMWCEELFMRWVWLILGLLAVAAGIVWTLQGLDILRGSGMSGNPTWAVVGPIVGVIGLALVGVGILRRPSAS